MKINPTFALTLLLSLTVAACSSTDGQKKKPENKDIQIQQTVMQKDSQPTGKYVEQASFTTLDGKKVSVSDFKGKVVIIDFWETWCKPCIASFPTLNKLQNEFPKHLKILAVTPGFTDTKEDAKNFVQNHDYDLTFLMDTNNLHKKLHVSAIPYRVFVDPQGEYIKTEVGNHGAKRDYRNIKQLVEKYFPSASNG